MPHESALWRASPLIIILLLTIFHMTLILISAADCGHQPATTDLKAVIELVSVVGVGSNVRQVPPVRQGPRNELEVGGAGSGVGDEGEC